MALTNVVYPVTGTDGAYSNIFPSQRRLDFTMTRQDAGITSISSGTGGVVRLEADATLTGIALGDYVNFGTEAYTPRSARVIALISGTTVELDLPFTSTNVTNGFINYKRNWFLEVRFVAKDSTTNQQDAVTLFDFTSKYNSSIIGAVVANLALPSVFLVPDFDASASGFNPGLWVDFKIQYRESWDTNRAESWVSPSPDVPIMLVHGTGDIEPLKFSDYGQLKRYVRGYPLMSTFIYSDVNDGVGGNQITLRANLYGIDKSLMAEETLATVNNFNGVYVLAFNAASVGEDDVFVKLESDYVADIGQYDPDDYDPDDYA
jgi:hypothetical protein